MTGMTLDDACDFRDRTIRFLRHVDDIDDIGVLNSFAITKAADNHWRDSREAQQNKDRDEFRPTVTCFSQEAGYALLHAVSSENLELRRAEWANAAVRALRRLNRVRGPGLQKLRSSMSNNRPNILSVSHLGIVLGRLMQAQRVNTEEHRLGVSDWGLVRSYTTLVKRYVVQKLRTRVCLAPGEPEHPYLVYRAVDCLSLIPGALSGVVNPPNDFCDRLCKNFDRLAAGLAYHDASPAEGVDLAFLWATLALNDQIPLSRGRWETCLDALLELSRPSGDWPLGHELSSGGKAGVVPSCEVASAILNALLSSPRWDVFPREQALKTLAYVRPLAERVMRELKHVRISNRRTIHGWIDPRVGSDSQRLQAFTTASHVLFLSRLLSLLRLAIRATVVSQFSKLKPDSARGPGFGRILEVDHAAPVAEYLWRNFICTVDPLAPTLPAYRKLFNKEGLQRVEQDRLILPSKDRKNTSLILYGPPGTGKTTYVCALASKLEWPLITITPGNFTHLGEGGIETAAQEVFRLLLKTDRVVVLLDECDELFRSREEQETGSRTLLNFLTASMLPKLADLHDKGELIFAIATNYLEKMDIAALRGGRIDHHVAVPPPDPRSRRALLEEYLEKQPDIRRYRRAWRRPIMKKAVRLCAGLTRDEIIKAVERFAHSVRNQSGLSTTRVTELLEMSLEAAQNGRLNNDQLLTDFYQHMQRHSAPVLHAKPGKWRLPAFVLKEIKRRAHASRGKNHGPH